MPTRDLPRRSGVATPAVEVSLGWLAKRGYLVVEPDPDTPRAKRARLTPKGVAAQDGYRRQVEVVETTWREAFGTAELRAALERLVGLVSPGPEPYPGSWRAALPRPETLPHHPMVSHRGGFPDGS